MSWSRRCPSPARYGTAPPPARMCPAQSAQVAGRDGLTECPACRVPRTRQGHDNARMTKTLDRAAQSLVKWTRGNASTAAVAALIGVAVARHPVLVLVPAVALASWAFADSTARRGCYSGACIRCGYTVNCAVILDGTREWVTGQQAALGVPRADVPRPLGWPAGHTPGHVNHAVFACKWCTFVGLRFHPDRTKLGGKLPVLREPRTPGRLARWAVRSRAPQTRFIGIPAGHPLGGYSG